MLMPLLHFALHQSPLLQCMPSDRRLHALLFVLFVHLRRPFCVLLFLHLLLLLLLAVVVLCTQVTQAHGCRQVLVPESASWHNACHHSRTAQDLLVWQ